VQPPGPAPVVCVVPVMRTLSLKAVERKLSAAHCRLGHVTHHYDAIPKGGLVEQSLHQGTIRPAGTEVDVWLSKGRRRRRAPSS
jgi:beta-lactam-binding protein with PASTA domain